MTTLEVKVPLVWQKLIDIVFPAENVQCLSGDKTDHAMDDPTPYVDDDRYIRVVGEGYEFMIGLASGQHNYYGYYELTVKQPDGSYKTEGDVLESYCDLDFPNLDFKIVINWKD